MNSPQGLRFASALAACAAGAILPVATLHFLAREEVQLSSTLHFWGVGATAFAAMSAAVALTFVGARRADARTVLVGTAFTVMAALLTLHGLASPGILVEYSGLVAFTGGATLPVGGVILALTSLPSLSLPQSIRRLLVLQAALLVAVALLGTIGMLVPEVVPDVPEPGSALAVAALAVGLVFYGFLALRAVNT